jgi:hypothetical protein
MSVACHPSGVMSRAARCPHCHTPVHWHTHCAQKACRPRRRWRWRRQKRALCVIGQRDVGRRFPLDGCAARAAVQVSGLGACLLAPFSETERFRHWHGTLAFGDRPSQSTCGLCVRPSGCSCRHKYIGHLQDKPMDAAARLADSETHGAGAGVRDDDPCVDEGSAGVHCHPLGPFSRVSVAPWSLCRCHAPPSYVQQCQHTGRSTMASAGRPLLWLQVRLLMCCRAG